MSGLYFSTPLFLAGLLTAAIPFLLLLTQAKTRRVTQFSTVMFLRTVMQKASNMIQWKRIILLIVRILILSALAIIFALPFVNQRDSLFSANVQTQLVFILDRSYSMGYREGAESLFDLSKKKIAEITKRYRKGKTAYALYGFGDHFETLFAPSVKSQGFEAVLKKLNATQQGSDFSKVIQGIKEDARLEGAARTHVFLISDFSIQDPKIKAEFIEKVREAAGSRVETHFIPIQPKEYNNVALQKFILPGRFFIPRAQEEIKVSYQVFGKAGKTLKATLWFDQSPMKTEEVEIPESGKGIISFKEVFPSAGSYPIKVVLQEDNLAADNVVYAVAKVHEPVRVLLVEDREFEYPFDNPNFYFMNALEAGKKAEDMSWISFTRSNPTTLADVDLSQYNLVVMPDLRAFETRSLTQVRAYMKSGGSVLFTLGDQFQLKKYSDGYLTGQFLGASFGDKIQREEKQQPFFLRAINYQHPMFQIFKEGKKGDLSKIPFDAYSPIISAEKTQMETLLQFENNYPAFVEIKKDKGRLFILSTSLNDDWGEFPKHPLFVPFVYELLKYVALNGGEVVFDAKMGESVEIKVANPAKAITLKTPQGESLSLIPDAKRDSVSLKVDQVGFYDWMDLQDDVMVPKRVAANLDVNESRVSYDSMQGVIKPEAVNETLSNHLGLASRKFVYLPILYCVFALLLMEAWLANRAYKPAFV